MPPRPTAGELIAATLRSDVDQIMRWEPLVQRDLGLAEGTAPVYRLRASCRRLSHHLGAFRPLLRRSWVDRLRDHLCWFTGLLAPARDAQALRIRLRRTAGADPMAPLDKPSIARIDAELTARYEEEMVGVRAAMGGSRYHTLVRSLVDAGGNPRLRPAAQAEARWATGRLTSGPWRDFLKIEIDRGYAEAPQRWRDLCRAAQRARWATEAVAPVLGAGALELAGGLAAVHGLLREQGAAQAAAQVWLDIAATDPDDHALAVTAGRLYERELAIAGLIDLRFEQVLACTARARVTGWLD